MTVIKHITVPKTDDQKEIRKHHESVAKRLNYHNVFADSSDGGPYISSTRFDIDYYIGAAWESLGPTGSGATNIWTALDVVPVDVDWIEVVIHSLLERTSGADIQAIAFGCCRKNGASTSAADSTTQLFYSTCVGGTTLAAFDGRSFTRKIPVSKVMFDLYLYVLNQTDLDISMYLTGYGFNK